MVPLFVVKGGSFHTNQQSSQGSFLAGSTRLERLWSLGSDLRPGPSFRPRTGRETPRNNANQREPVINQNGRPEAVSGRLRRSAVWGASIWGTEGREFKSPQPDKQTPCFNRRFADPEVSRRTAGVSSGRVQAARFQKWRSGTARPDLL